MKALLLLGALSAGCGAARSDSIDGTWARNGDPWAFQFTGDRYVAQGNHGPTETGQALVDGHHVTLIADKATPCGWLGKGVPVAWELRETSAGLTLQLWWPDGLRGYEQSNGLPPPGDDCPRW